MPMGSLSALLHGNSGAGRTPLNWETRSGIALELLTALNTCTRRVLFHHMATLSLQISFLQDHMKLVSQTSACSSC
uniref:Uncharacterized protein n=1 Tax=Cannabis sativa TaxID=3483 RepID=A0A803RA76_CANSA